MRGEELNEQTADSFGQELPPHARRRAQRAVQIFAETGITSACAEKSH